jgi:uncharacterized protein YcbK (DUF882 family)
MEETLRPARPLTRRSWLKACVTGLAAVSLPALAKPQPARHLSFRHLHTGETLSVNYFQHGRYDPRALKAVNHLLRDFRTDDVFPIAPALLDQLFVVHRLIGSDAPFEIISAYRSPATNAMLHRASSGVASGSLHMQGKAIDIRLADTRTRHVRDAALKLGAGGVGYYPSSNFVHLDIGRVRRW